MVRNIGQLLMLICLLTVGGVVANAQVSAVPQIEANVPFDFVVGDTKLPAGKYEIRAIDETSNSVLEIHSVNTRTAVLFDTGELDTGGDEIKGKTQLVFNKVAGQYFLSQIWVAGTSSGNALIPSRMEKRLMAGGAAQPEKQSVVAVLKRMKP